ncbi:Hypothetical predicted protein [Pelobates cultripes]|nr:Hypothetical predicted protein [Pelobates cultripes]
MAATTCAQGMEQTDLSARLDELFARFWRTIAIREQRAKAHNIATMEPANPRHKRMPPPAIGACKRPRGRHTKRTRKPKQLTPPLAATHPHKCPENLNLPERQPRQAGPIKGQTRPRDHKRTTPQPLNRRHHEADPRPGIPWRQHNHLRYVALHRIPHANRSALPEWDPDLATAKTSSVVQSGWQHYSIPPHRNSFNSPPSAGIG